jgi:hypothetical protein
MHGAVRNQAMKQEIPYKYVSATNGDSVYSGEIQPDNFRYGTSVGRSRGLMHIVISPSLSGGLSVPQQQSSPHSLPLRLYNGLQRRRHSLSSQQVDIHTLIQYSLAHLTCSCSVVEAMCTSAPRSRCCERFKCPARPILVATSHRTLLCPNFGAYEIATLHSVSTLPIGRGLMVTS